MMVVAHFNDPEAWRSQAACAGEVGVAFYPPLRPEKRSAKGAREERAKALCASCPVRQPCLDEAVAHGERFGIWGGLTDRERTRLLAS